MAQHDMVLDNSPGATIRSDINAAILALVTNSSGATEPTSTYPFMWWPDTTAGILKQRNSANTAWIDILTLSTGKPIGLALGTDIMAYVAPGTAGNVLTSDGGGWVSGPPQSGQEATLAETQAGIVTGKFVSPSTFYGSSLGIGQTWQNVTGSRTVGTTYYNTTGKPITVNISTGNPTQSYAILTISGIQVTGGGGTTGTYGGTSWLIPPGASYALTASAGTPMILGWAELR